MNVVKFYRLLRDGSVEEARVRVSQPPSRSRVHKGYVRRLPSVRQAEDFMLARGWARHRPSATSRITMMDAVRRALAVA